MIQIYSLIKNASKNINEYSSFEPAAKINTIEKYTINKEKLCSSSWNYINYINKIDVLNKYIHPINVFDLGGCLFVFRYHNLQVTMTKI